MALAQFRPRIWLPHLDSWVNKQWTLKSSEHENFAKEVHDLAGTLTLRTALNLEVPPLIVGPKEATLKIPGQSQLHHHLRQSKHQSKHRWQIVRRAADDNRRRRPHAD
jgi:hypothetical protein